MGLYESTIVFQGKIVTREEKLDLEKEGGWESPFEPFKTLSTEGPGKFAFYRRMVTIPKEVVVAEKIVGADSRKMTWSEIQGILEKIERPRPMFTREFGPEVNLLRIWEYGERGVWENGDNFGPEETYSSLTLRFCHSIIQFNCGVW
jgi:hypothetical protein